MVDQEPNRFRAWIDAAASIIMALSALVIAGLVVRQQFFPPDPNASVMLSGSEWRELKAAGGQRLGADEPSATIVEFGDYQCPFCARLQPSLDSILDEYPSVQLIYHHLPLTRIHPEAYWASRVAECAADQGAFAEVHRFLYEVEELDKLTAATVLAQVTLPDSASFITCAQRERPVATIERDIALAEKYGIVSTPRIIVDGLELGRTPSAHELRELLGGERKNAEGS